MRQPNPGCILTIYVAYVCMYVCVSHRNINVQAEQNCVQLRMRACISHDPCEARHACAHTYIYSANEQAARVHFSISCSTTYIHVHSIDIEHK